MLNFEIEIRPIKWLYYNLENEQRNAHAVIVSSYNVRKEKISALVSVLILSFDDIVDGDNCRAFNRKFAEEIFSYIKSLPSDTEVLYVCCDSGESRSSAITASLLKIYGKGDMAVWENPRYHPNPLVYRLMCEEAGVILSDGEIAEKVALNENALTKAVLSARNK